MQDLLEKNKSAPHDGRRSPKGSLWVIVLSGGEGVRLRPLIREICGDERPKQYVPLFESRSLLQQTVARIAGLIPPERTVLVTMRSHAAYIARELGELGHPRVLFQPEDRGTAAAVLLSTHWILARDPQATVVVVPSDHLVVEEALFLGHLAAVARFVQREPGWLALLGAQPTEPETEYGWVEAGPRVGLTTEGPLHRVFRFWEKPSRELASTLLMNGSLWNTFVVVAGAGTLVATAGACVPELNDRLARLCGFFGTEQESRAIGQAYALAPRASFSRSMLQRCPRALAVSKLPALTWCDLGTPARVVKTLTSLGISPPWLSRLPRPA